MLSISMPSSFRGERTYIVDVLLREFLGLEFRLSFESRHDVLIKKDGDDASLVLSDQFWTHAQDCWLAPESLPAKPLKRMDLSAGFDGVRVCSNLLPVIYGSSIDSGGFCDFHDSCIELGLDVFGSAFFMLTRYEEVATGFSDDHDRFYAKASVAYQENFLHRPIVNEYLEILWFCLQKLWPSLTRKKRKFRTCPTHDVDSPFAFIHQSRNSSLRVVARDLIRRRSPSLFFKNILNSVFVRMGRLKRDPYNTFDWIMALSDEVGVRSTFYFISDHSSGNLDGGYSIMAQDIRVLLRSISQRGHKVGLHPSYETYLDVDQLRHELRALKSVCKEEGVPIDGMGSRQHYLRFKFSETPAYLSEAGSFYDSSLGYADWPGFRCGVCYEFPLYDLLRRRPLEIYEKPLIFMECTVTAGKYMGLGYGEGAFREMATLKDSCRLFNGDFVFLWHNSLLVSSEERSLYEKIVKY